MGIDFQCDKEMVTLNSKDFATFYPVFNMLNKKTGVTIDEYANSLLSPNHAKMLLDIIPQTIDKKLLSGDLIELLNLFEKAVQTNTWIKIIGE